MSSVQAQKRSPVTLGTLFHDHLVSILFIFSGVFLVNYVLISSAAVESGDALLLTFQDVVELMNQVRVCLPFCSFNLIVKFIFGCCCLSVPQQRPNLK
jgi:ethylene-insensitive protein 2